MKRMLFTWVIIALLIYPSVCIASYLIQLKNGQEFITPEYWEEANQVKFYFYGGIVAFEKDEIQAITESDKPYVEEALDTRAPEAPGIGAKEPGAETRVGAKEPGAEGKTESEKEEREEEIDFEYYREKRLMLKSKLAEAKERVRVATRNRDLEAKKKAKQDMRKFAGEIYKLKDELTEKNKGVVPDQWWQD